MDIAPYNAFQLEILNTIATKLENKQKTMVFNKCSDFCIKEIEDQKEEILANDEYGLALLMQVPLWIENSGIDWLNTKNWANIIRNHKATYNDILDKYLPVSLLDELDEEASESSED